MGRGVVEAEEVLVAVVAGLDPDGIDAEGAVELFGQFDRIERLAAAAKTLLARRVEASGTWQRRGYASAAEHVAALTGSSVSAARDTIATSDKIGSLPLVARAMREGAVSRAQAEVIADAAALAPGLQSKLLRDATRSSFKELRDECQRAKAAADADPDATHRRLHRSRCLRTYTDAEGGWNLRARGTVDAGARIEAALAPLIDAEFATARAQDRHEPRHAYGFDALVALADRADPSPAGVDGAGRRRPRAPQHLTLVRVDLAALRRGATVDDERCEITGIGPIPVSVARDLLGDSIVKLVITNGVDVVHVTHLGRGPTAAQRIALLWQQPQCTVEGCCRTRVEIDHRIPYATTRHTRLDNCDPLCTHHHHLKTYDGWALVDGTGSRPMVPPDHPRHPHHRPPP